MKFVIAMMQHETNTFSPLPTPYEAFAGGTGFGRPPEHDDALTAYLGTGTPFAAFLDLAEQAGADIVVPIAAYAEPSGPVARDAFETICRKICDAVAAGCDALFLDLHGAMVVEGLDDGEGELLKRVRKLAPNLPIAVALDFHTNLSEAMVANATVISGYRTYPHIDMYETGMRCGRILLRALAGDVEPRMQWGAAPMLPHMLRQTPAAQPMKDIMDRAIAAGDTGAVLDASVFGGFPLADIPHARLSAITVCDRRAGPEGSLLGDLLDMAWERRAAFVYDAEPPSRAVAHAKTLVESPVLLVDHGDNCGAGGSMDDMTVIGEVLRQGLENVAAGPIWDSEAVAAMRAAGAGAKITLPVGGKTDSPAIGLKGKPLELTGTVRNLTDGRFVITGPMMTGARADIGPSAVFDTGSMEILVCSKRWEPFDPGVFRHADIEPAKKRYLVIKSRQHFRAGFEDIAAHIVLAAGPGVCSSDYEQFPFRNLARPIYPLDRDFGENRPILTQPDALAHKGA